MALSKADEILAKCGGLGPFQVRMLVLFSIQILPVAYLSYTPIFVLTIPKHRCALDNYINDTFAVQSPEHWNLINSSIPWDDEEDTMSSCKKYSTKALTVNGTSTREAITCSRYVYDQTFFQNSFIEQFDIVCDRVHLRPLTNGMMMLGKFVAGLITGFMSDYFGRKNTVRFIILLVVVVALTSPFPMNITALMATRFFAGLCTTSLYLVAYVTALEFLCPEHRRLFSVITSMVYIAGSDILIFIAYFVRETQALMLWVGIPSVLFFSYYWLIPESPRWLLSKGRVSEAQVIFQRIARTNKQKLPANVFELMNEDEEEAKSKEDDLIDDKGNDETEIQKPETMFTIFRYRKMTIIFVCILFNWVADSLTYYALMFNISNLPGSIYINYFILTCVDALANSALYFILDRFGRKPSYVGIMSIATLGCFLCIIPAYVGNAESQYAIIVLALVGRGAISTAYNLMYLHSSELFPTGVRNSALGTFSMSAKITSFFSPYIADMGLLIGGPFKQILPMLMCGSFALIGLILALFLPETMGKDLPNNFTEALKLHRTAHSVSPNQYKKCRKPEVQD